MVEVLLEFYLSAYFFESFLQSLSSCFVKTFFYSCGSSVNDVLSLFQTKTGLLLNGLNNLEFLCTCTLENYIKRCLLLSGSSLTCSSRTGSNCNSCSGGFNTILLFQYLSEFINFLNGKVTNCSAIAFTSAIIVSF